MRILRKGIKVYDLGIRYCRNHQKVWLAFLLGFWGGIANCLVDIDHWFNTQTFIIPALLPGRPLHIPLAIIASCVAIYSCTRIRGLDVKLVLKRDWAKVKLILIMVVFIIVLLALEYLWIIFMGDI